MTIEAAREIVNMLLEDNDNYNVKQALSVIDRHICLAERYKATEKYRWHDLRKNPNDLPRTKDSYCPCLVARVSEGQVLTDYCEYGICDGYGYLFLGIPQDEVVAWKYIEPYEEEVEEE